MKHLDKFESFDGGGIFGDQMEEITGAIIINDKVYKYKSLTEKELQRLTNFCDEHGFEIVMVPEIPSEVKKGRLDRFKDYVTSKFVSKKVGPKVGDEFCFRIHRDKFEREDILSFLPDLNRNDTFNCLQMSLFKTKEDFFYLNFFITIYSHGEQMPVGRKFYRFDEMRTFFKFVEDLVN